MDNSGLENHAIGARLNFSFVIAERLAGMAMPGCRNPLEEEILFLKENTITHLVNLGDMEYVYDDYRQQFRVADIPVPEFAPPSARQMDLILLQFNRLKQGEAMGVHCAGGVGRTGTVLACLLGRYHKIDGKQAVFMIRDLRPGSIESASQQTFVVQYLGGAISAGNP